MSYVRPHSTTPSTCTPSLSSTLSSSHVLHSPLSEHKPCGDLPPHLSGAVAESRPFTGYEPKQRPFTGGSGRLPIHSAAPSRRPRRYDHCRDELRDLAVVSPPRVHFGTCRTQPSLSLEFGWSKFQRGSGKSSPREITFFHQFSREIVWDVEEHVVTLPGATV